MVAWNHTVANVLTAHTDHVTAPQPRMEKQRKAKQREATQRALVPGALSFQAYGGVLEFLYLRFRLGMTAVRFNTERNLNDATVYPRKSHT